jgi:hypothetical protein
MFFHRSDLLFIGIFAGVFRKHTSSKQDFCSFFTQTERKLFTHQLLRLHTPHFFINAFAAVAIALTTVPTAAMVFATEIALVAMALTAEIAVFTALTAFDMARAFFAATLYRFWGSAFSVSEF